MLSKNLTITELFIFRLGTMFNAITPEGRRVALVTTPASNEVRRGFFCHKSIRYKQILIFSQKAYYLDSHTIINLKTRKAE